MRWWRAWAVSVMLVGALVSGVRAYDTDPSVSIQAARHGLNGAVLPVQSTVDANGAVLPAPAEAGEYLIVSGTALPPNLPVLAYLVTPTQTFPLGAYPPTAALVMTDKTGSVQAAYQLPPPAAISERNAQITLVVEAGGDAEAIAVTTSIVFALPPAA